MKFIFTLIFGFLTVCFFACGQKREFINDYFNVTVNVQPGWSIRNQEQIDAHVNLMNAQLEALGRPFTEEEKKQIESQNPFLLILSKSSNLESTPLIMINHVLLSGPKDDTSIVQYLNGSRKRLIEQYSAGLILNFSDPVEESIGNRDFIARTLKMTGADNFVSYQKIFCSIKNGFFLNIVCNYSNEKEKKMVYKQLDKFEFK